MSGSVFDTGADTGPIFQAASAAQGLAGQLEDTVAQLEGTVSSVQSQWLGSASSAFQATSADLIQAIGKYAQHQESAGQLLQTLGTDITKIQAELKTLEKKANQALQSAQANATIAARSGGPAGAAARAAAARAQQEYNQIVKEAGELQTELRTIYNDAQQLLNQSTHSATLLADTFPNPSPAAAPEQSVGSVGGGTTDSAGAAAMGGTASGGGGGAAAPAAAAPVNLTANEQLGEQMAAARGWTGQQWNALFQLWQRESGWSNTAENPSSGAYGIAQALGHGPTNQYPAGPANPPVSSPQAQIQWGLNYIAQTYGTPAAAWAHELQFGWY